MHDPKFEKEVQQKMEELVFSPSDAVWAKVQQAVGKEKKRRVPMFWLFFLPGLILIGAGGLYFGNRAKTAPFAKVVSPNKVVSSKPGQGQTQEQLQEPTAMTTDRSSEKSQSEKSQSEKSLSEKSPVAEGSAHKDALTQKESGTAGNNRIDHKKQLNNPGHLDNLTAGSTQQGTTQQKARPDASGSRKANPGDNLLVTKHNSVLPIVLSDQLDIEDAAGGYGIGKQTMAGRQQNKKAATATSTGKIVPVSIFGYPEIFSGFSTISRSASKTKAAALSSNQALQAASLTKLSPKRSWEAGFTGGIGVSNVRSALLKSSSIQAYDLTTANGLTAVTARAQKPFTSNVRPGPSFWAGITMQKQISKRFTVSTGLSLHYYSTRIKTGEKVDNYQPALSSNFFAAPAPAGAPAPAPAPAPVTVYPYYALGDEQVYTNRYYFLELPASLQYRLNHSKSMPLFWEGGVSLSYLMSSNALYYNQKSDVYNKDGRIANRAQVNVSTALLIGLPVGSSRLQAGPQLQYGLTSLLQESSAGGQHLFYGGIKLVLLPAGKGRK